MSDSENGTTEEAEPTQAEQDLERAKTIIEPLAKAGQDEDAMVVALIQSDFGAKKAFRYVNKALISLGVRMSTKDRYETVCELLLENDFQPTEWKEVKDVAEYLAQEIDSTTEKQAMVAIRKFAKDNGVTLPDRPKGKGGGGRGAGFKGVMLNWFVENITASDDDFKAFVKGHDKPETLAKRFLGYRAMALKVHAAMVEAKI